MKASSDDLDSQYEAMVKEEDSLKYVLELYVTGMSPKSRLSIKKVKELCETFLAGRYELKVIDLFQNPEEARKAQIIAAPTLLKLLPLPLRKIIGDMADEDRVLIGLDIRK